jgi:hypothetical protein
MQYNPTQLCLIDDFSSPWTVLHVVVCACDDAGLLSLHLNLSFVKPTFLIPVVCLVYITNSEKLREYFCIVRQRSAPNASVAGIKFGKRRTSLYFKPKKIHIGYSRKFRIQVPGTPPTSSPPKGPRGVFRTETLFWSLY